MVKRKSPGNLILGICSVLSVLFILGFSAYDSSNAEESITVPIITLTSEGVTPFVTLTPVVVPTEGPRSNTISFTLESLTFEELANSGYVQVSSMPANSPVINLPSTEGKLSPPFSSVRITGFKFGTLPVDWALSHGLSATSFHRGLDINSTPFDQPVVSSCDGTVLFAGLRATVRAAINVMCSPNTLPGHTLEMRYYHMDESWFATHGMIQGASFIKGQILGMLAPGSACGTLCSGKHLHIEILVDGVHVDPALYLSLGV